MDLRQELEDYKLAASVEAHERKRLQGELTQALALLKDIDEACRTMDAGMALPDNSTTTFVRGENLLRKTVKKFRELKQKLWPLD